jgi:hypothetical protein
MSESKDTLAQLLPIAIFTSAARNASPTYILNSAKSDYDLYADLLALDNTSVPAFDTSATVVSSTLSLRPSLSVALTPTIGYNISHRVRVYTGTGINCTLYKTGTSSDKSHIARLSPVVLGGIALSVGKHCYVKVEYNHILKRGIFSGVKGMGHMVKLGVGWSC